MKNTLQTRLGLFFALAFVAAVVILETIGGLEFLKRGKTLAARFTNVLELNVGDPVKMAGKQIGRVERIEFADDKVRVAMKITDPRARIRTDSRATIRFTGLMGQNYVAIDFGTGQAPEVEDGAELETYEQPDFNQLMTRLEGVTSGIKKLTDTFSESNLGDLLVPFTDFLNESKPRILTLLSNAESISTQVARGQGTVGRLLFEDTLYTSALDTVTNVNRATADAQGLLGDARAVVADLRAGRGTVGRLLTEDQLYTETTTAVTNLREILQKVNRGEGTVGKVINDTTLLDNAKLTLQKLDKATEGLEDQGPLSVLGILINPLF
jgi:phospholipid/cholesterol/gamma-HCH transport system substrate-binding protein